MHKLQKQPRRELTDEQITEPSKLWGVYVGEVIRRYYGGQWAIGRRRARRSRSAARSSPVAKARKRIVDGPTENITTTSRRS